MKNHAFRLLSLTFANIGLAGIALLAACGGGGGGGGGPGGAPTGITYPTNPAIYATCTAIADNIPNVTGGAPTLFAIAPALPAGLSFSTVTGVISGTPTVASAITNYTVTASNGAGQAQVVLPVTVTSSDPTGMSYDDLAPTYPAGLPITPNAPTFVSGSAEAYVVTAGTLPVGIELDPDTGVLSGTPLLAQGAGAVTIEATGCAGGTDTAIVTITVAAPATRAAFLANESEDTVSFFVQHAASGQLRHNGFIATGDGPRAIATNLSGTFAFVGLNAGSQIQSYAIDPASGRLTISGTAVASTGNPVGLAVEPLGRYLYSANAAGTVRSYAIGSGNGQLTPTTVASIAAGTATAAVAVDALARFVYAANTGSDDISGYSIDPATGNLTALAGSPFAAGDSPSALVIDPTGGFLYCANSGTGDTISAYSIDGTTGALTELSGLGSPYAAGTDPLSIAISSDGGEVYTADFGAGTISVFSRNTTNGQLTAGAAATTGTGPGNVAVDPAGAYAYSVNIGDAELRSFSIGGGGALTAVAPFETRTRAAPRALVFAPSQTNATFTTDAVYAANNADQDFNQFGADPTTGALNPLSPAQVATSAVTPNWMTVHPTLDVLYATFFNGAGTSIQRFTLDAGGVATAAGTHGTVNGNWATVIDPSGRFAFMTGGAVGSGRVTPFSIDQSTGALTAGTDAVAGDQPRGAAVHPNGKFLYVANQFSGNVSQYSIDATTGALTAIGAPIAAGSAAHSIAIDPTGRLAYVACSGVTGAADGSIAMFSINATTGALTALAAAAPVGWSDTFDIAVHPNGRFLYVADQLLQSITQFLINTNPGNATEDGSLLLLTTMPAAQPVRYIRINAAGTVLYAGSESAATVGSQVVLTYSLDGTNGSMTLIDTDATGATTRGLGSRDRVE